jgi:hypothetical protein
VRRELMILAKCLGFVHAKSTRTDVGTASPILEIVEIGGKTKNLH